jgi:hypothetical protein
LGGRKANAGQQRCRCQQKSALHHLACQNKTEFRCDRSVIDATVCVEYQCSFGDILRSNSSQGRLAKRQTFSQFFPAVIKYGSAAFLADKELDFRSALLSTNSANG